MWNLQCYLFFSPIPALILPPNLSPKVCIMQRRMKRRRMGWPWKNKNKAFFRGLSLNTQMIPPASWLWYEGLLLLVESFWNPVGRMVWVAWPLYPWPTGHFRHSASSSFRTTGPHLHTIHALLYWQIYGKRRYWPVSWPNTIDQVVWCMKCWCGYVDNIENIGYVGNIGNIEYSLVCVMLRGGTTFFKS